MNRFSSGMDTHRRTLQRPGARTQAKGFVPPRIAYPLKHGFVRCDVCGRLIISDLVRRHGLWLCYDCGGGREKKTDE